MKLIVMAGTIGIGVMARVAGGMAWTTSFNSRWLGPGFMADISGYLREFAVIFEYIRVLAGFWEYMRVIFMIADICEYFKRLRVFVDIDRLAGTTDMANAL